MRDQHEPKLVLRRPLSRRDFLRLAGVAAAGVLVGGCRQATPVPAEETAAPKTATPGTTAPTAPAGSGAAKVALAQAESYDPDLVSRRVRDLLDGIGGLDDVVSTGDRVAIKVNLTGGTYWKGPRGRPAIETFVTHPEVVRALGRFVLDAGAKELFIVEAVYQWASFTEWGCAEVAEDLGATLVDLNATEPYADYTETPVPGDHEVYESFTFNPILEEIDTFISISKLKAHCTCGVTHTMKNLVGLVPARFYRLTPDHSHRSAFHGPDSKKAGQRVPRIIVELNKARPIHLGVVDGIMTAQGGEGPWNDAHTPIEPHVLLAGKDVVATDAVATAVMGFDPAAPSWQEPFLHGDNHLALASEAGLGTHRLEEIEVVGGVAIDDVRTDFRPCPTN